MPWIDLAFAVALLAVLVPIAVIDLRAMIIPDRLTLALAALGLAWQALTLRALPLGAILFSAALLAGFLLLRALHFRLRGVTGLGLGDVKMAGAAGLWFSPWNLPLFLFSASFSALVFVLVCHLAGARAGSGIDKGARIPFGPFIAAGLFLTWTLERSGFPTFVPDRGFR